MKKRFKILTIYPVFKNKNVEQRFYSAIAAKQNSYTLKFILVFFAFIIVFLIADIALFKHSEPLLISVVTKSVTILIGLICYQFASRHITNYRYVFFSSNFVFVAFIANLVVMIGLYIKYPVGPLPPTVFEAVVPYLLFILIVGLTPSSRPSLNFSFIFLLWLGYVVEVYLFYDASNPVFGYSMTYLVVVTGLSVFSCFVLQRYRRLFWAKNSETQLKTRQILRQKESLRILTEKYKSQSLIDDLTKIANRRAFTRELENAVNNYVRNKHLFSLFIIDIDHFKSVNDVFGHAVGDKVLCHTVNTLKGCIRNTDKLFRVGGEEFAILSFHTSEEQDTALAKRIQKSLKDKPLVHNEHSFNSTVSQGICSVGLSSTSFEDIYSLADQALYEAKIERDTFIRYQEPEEEVVCGG